MSEHVIYRIDCATSGKAYIGLTKVGAHRRFRDHRYAARTGRAGALYAAMRLYGEDAFTLSVLEEGLAREQACEREIALIAEHCTRAPHGYNVSSGGEHGAAGVARPPETRARIAAAVRLVCQDPAVLERKSAAQRGRVFSDETRRKMSEAHMGRKMSPEHIAARSAGQRGKPKSEEWKAKVRATLARKREERERASG